jgi:hypothetical protein
MYSQSYRLRNGFQQHELVVMAEKIKKYGVDCSKIYIQDLENQPYIYLTVFTDISPFQFQAMEKTVNSDWIWDHFLRLGKYYFETNENIQREFNNYSSERRLFLTVEKRSDQNAIDSVFTDEAGWLYFYKR